MNIIFNNNYANGHRSVAFGNPVINTGNYARNIRSGFGGWGRAPIYRRPIYYRPNYFNPWLYRPRVRLRYPRPFFPTYPRPVWGRRPGGYWNIGINVGGTWGGGLHRGGWNNGGWGRGYNAYPAVGGLTHGWNRGGWLT